MEGGRHEEIEKTRPAKCAEKNDAAVRIQVEWTGAAIAANQLTQPDVDNARTRRQQKRPRNHLRQQWQKEVQDKQIVEPAPPRKVGPGYGPGKKYREAQSE